ncbi:MAG: adenylate/guanylate cyclase domain-containing protein [Deltaproteobacteria bacterium]|nr:adenylate/guanylate cyclase domain-containing protein [Deltaproteobacteria bacterium]
MKEFWTGLSLTELIALQDEISRHIRAKFERKLALVFTDVVGSTAYFSRFGDTAGRALCQRHLNILDRAVATLQGRVVDTAGDGAFSVFPTVERATEAMIALQQGILGDNREVGEDHRLSVRVGIHWNNVLSDGKIVTGDAVHVAARVASTADAGEIHLSQDAVSALPPHVRVNTRSLGPHPLKGVPAPLDIFRLDWLDPNLFPRFIRVNETQQELLLPDQDVVTFGRLAVHEGKRANDVVLAHPDEDSARRIGRWHFKIRRAPDGLLLSPVSRAPTVVDGRSVQPGEEARVRSGSIVRVSDVLTLTFHAAQADQSTLILA